MNPCNPRREVGPRRRPGLGPEDGITLMEIVIVVTIILVVAVFSLPSLSPAQRRLRALQDDYTRMLDFIDRARFGAMNGASDWLLVMETDKLGGQLRIGPDDGWNQAMTGLNVRAKIYSLDDSNLSMFNDAERNDNSLSTTEQVAASSLTAHVKLLPAFGDDSTPGVFTCPTWLRFRHDGVVQTSSGVGSMTVLWLADESFDTADPKMSSLTGKQEWVKPIIVLPTGAVYLPFED